jgi:hypothetical protein
MMNLDIERGPIQIGEGRSLFVAGDGPFLVSTACFVDNPPPPGFRGCSECLTVEIQSGESVYLQASRDFWEGRKGHILITCRDSTGSVREIKLIVLPEDEATPIASGGGGALLAG